MPRWLPPVHTPVTLRSVLAASAAALPGSRRPNGQVRDLLLAHFAASAVLPTASGTIALMLALAGARRRADDLPVAMPAWGCYDLASAAVGAGARVRLYDVDPVTLAPDARSLAAAVQAGVSAVVLVHLYGMPVDPASLAGVIGDTLVIEDAAQGAGGRVGPRPLGGLGSLSVLSFGRGKGIGGGGGGALIANDERGAEVVRDLALRGAPPAGWGDVLRVAAVGALTHPVLYWAPASLPFLRLGETIYRPPRPPGPPSRAAMMVMARGWGNAVREAEVRRAHAARFHERLLGHRTLVPVTAARDTTPGYLRFPVLARDVGMRDRAAASGRRLGAAPGYPMPLNALRPMREACVPAAEDFAGARALSERLLTLPTHSRLRERDLAALDRWMVAEAGR